MYPLGKRKKSPWVKYSTTIYLPVNSRKIRLGFAPYTWKHLFMAVKKYFPKQKIFLSISPQRPEMDKIIEEELNAKCMGGQSVDGILLNKNITMNFFTNSVYTDNGKDELWLYYNKGLTFQKLSKFQRLMNGIWLWLTPFEGNLPWAYQHIYGNPYNFKEDMKFDLNYTFPRLGKTPFSSKSWEAMANGVNDMKYLDKIKELADNGNKDAIKFLSLLKKYYLSCRETLVLMDNQTSVDLLIKLRWAMANILNEK